MKAEENHRKVPEVYKALARQQCKKFRLKDFDYNDTCEASSEHKSLAKELWKGAWKYLQN